MRTAAEYSSMIITNFAEEKRIGSWNMKGSIRLHGVVLLTMLYCFAIGTINISPAYPGFQDNESASEIEQISAWSSKLYCQISPSENSINNINNLPVKPLKTQFAGFWAILKVTNHLFETELSQYSTLARNVLIKFRKSDLIFPFQYFW